MKQLFRNAVRRSFWRFCRFGRVVGIASAFVVAGTLETQAAKPGGGGGGVSGNPVIVYIGNGDLKVMDVDGSNQRVVLSGGKGHMRHPSFFPDGQRLLFAYYDMNAAKNGIFSVNLGGTGRTRIVGHSPWDTRPSVSPVRGAHGLHRIAFNERIQDGRSRLFVINEDGTGLQRLTTREASAGVEVESSPTWSPDGKYLAYSYGAENGGVRLFGSGLRLLSLGEDPAGNIWVEDDVLLLRDDFESRFVALYPSFSKAAYKIYFTGSPDPSQPKDVWALHLDELLNPTGLQQITATVDLNEHIVSGSGDDSKIAYELDRTIYVANSDGSDPQPRQSANGPQHQQMPSFR